MKSSITKRIVAGKTRYYIVVDLPNPKGTKRMQKWISAGTSYLQAEALRPKVLLEVQSKNFSS